MLVNATKRVETNIMQKTVYACILSILTIAYQLDD